MTDSSSSPDGGWIAMLDEIEAAGEDAVRLDDLGFRLGVGGHDLPPVLASLPATDHLPYQTASLVQGYLRGKATSDAADSTSVRIELERRRAELRALQRVNAVATASLDENTVLNNVVGAVADVMNVDVCSIYLRQGQNQLVLRATYGLSQDAVGRARLHVGEGVTGLAAEQGKPVAVPDIWADSRSKYLPETKEDAYHSLLSVPIKAAATEYVQGVVNVQTRDVCEFTNDDIGFLEMIAGQLGLSIENARSYGQTDAQLRQKVNALTTLHQVVLAVSSSLDLRRVLNTIARQALTLCQGDSSAILARKGQQLLVEAFCGDGELEHTEFVREIAREAIQQGAHQIQLSPPGEDHVQRALLCVPLRGHGSTYGALAVFGKADQGFDGETSDLLTDFACEAAMAIENAQLHQATQQSLEAKSVLLSELHHRVKNNLQTVGSLLSLALRHTKSEEAAETLRDSYNRVQSIAAAHDLLSRQTIGVTTIGEVANKVISLLEPTVQAKGTIKFTAEGDQIDVETREATTLAILLNELLTNAMRHGLRGREGGTIRVLFGRQGSEAWVSVADDGNGLPPDFTLNKNRGLGLSIVRTLVEADLHGQVNWESDHGGARFTLLFAPAVGSGLRATSPRA